MTALPSHRAAVIRAAPVRPAPRRPSPGISPCEDILGVLAPAVPPAAPRSAPDAAPLLAPAEAPAALADPPAPTSTSAAALLSAPPAPPVVTVPPPADWSALGPAGLAGWMLRDRAALTAAIRAGAHSPRLRRDLAVVTACGAGLYGAAVGVAGGPLQMCAGAVKLPLLLLGAAAISAPVLTLSTRVFGAAIRAPSLLTLTLQALGTASLVMAGLAPALAVWWLSITGAEPGLDPALAADAAWWGYRRVVLGGLVVAAAGGALGAARLSSAVPMRAAVPWAGAFAAAALQLAWLLRPIVSRPGEGAVLRPLEGDGVDAVLRVIEAVLRGAS
ncbi:MAG: hypothetical protein JNM72_21005 [Deltaproteobacteria bacterium]|nr:hypothetical protein [Deltaproteobacteria bacterium]